MKKLIIKLIGWYRPFNGNLPSIKPQGINRSIVPSHFNNIQWDSQLFKNQELI